MKHHSKKINEIKESNNFVFEGIFGNKKQNVVQQGSGQAEKVGQGKYRIGKSIVTELKGAPEAVFLGYDFEKSPLKWLLDSVFEGGLDINLSTTPHSLVNFSGKWKSGVYKGQYFGRYSEFLGGQFGDESSSPKFFGPYNMWMTSPHYFFSGIMDNTKEGILGYRNLSFGNIKNSFNILSIPPGAVVTIELNGGKKHTIYCARRFSNKDNVLSYNIVNGKTNEEYEVTKDWADIRGNTPTEFLKKTNINLQTASKIIEIFGLDISEGIVSASMSSAGSTSARKTEEPVKEPVEKTEEELSKTQQHYDLSRAPFIGIKKLGGEYWNENGESVKNNVGRIYFNAPDSEYLKQFENVVKNLDNKVIEADFRKLRSSLESGFISGAPVNYPWLANLIGKDKDSKKIEDARFLESLNRIEAFLKYFVDIIVKYAGITNRAKGNASEPNQQIKDLIKTNLRGYLGRPIAASGAKKTTTPSKPVKKGSIISEEVFESLKKIISEKLKHI
jgi:hypothetical protein